MQGWWLQLTVTAGDSGCRVSLKPFLATVTCLCACVLSSLRPDNLNEITQFPALQSVFKNINHACDFSFFVVKVKNLDSAGSGVCILCGCILSLYFIISHLLLCVPTAACQAHSQLKLWEVGLLLVSSFCQCYKKFSARGNTCSLSWKCATLKITFSQFPSWFPFAQSPVSLCLNRLTVCHLVQG